MSGGIGNMAEKDESRNCSCEGGGEQQEQENEEISEQTEQTKQILETGEIPSTKGQPRG